MNLASLPPGSAASLTGLTVPRHHATAERRLRELGLRPGARVTVLQRTAFGGRVVLLGQRRIALDAATVRCVEVAA